MSFKPLLAAAGGILSSFSASRGPAKSIPGRHSKSLAFDLCLVASGIRAGFLLDTFTPPNPPELFSSLIQILRNTLPEFRQVVHVHDETSNQTFFVNIALLRKNCEDAYLLGGGETNESRRPTSNGWIDFVSLETPPVLMTRQPELRRVWDHLIGSIALNPSVAAIQIPSGLMSGQGHLLVPLAAFLLEYPVGYVPLDENQTTYLSNVPLDVYEWVLEDSDEGHLLLKFSCPQCVSQPTTRLAPDEVRRRLADRFQPRIKAVGYPGRLEVRHTRETLPRVAL